MSLYKDDGYTEDGNLKNVFCNDANKSVGADL